MTAPAQVAGTAIWAQVPSRSPLTRGRPRFPVGGGFGPYSTALAGSRVVQVVPSAIRDSPWKAVPLPRHSRNSTGKAAGEEQNGSFTTRAATTQVFPNATFLPPCADPSYAHRAWNTFRPHRLKNVPSHATTSGSPSASRYLTASRATARPSSSMSHTAPAKNQHARRHFPAIPPAAAIATTVLRSARIIPHASATNSRYVDRRANTGASSSSRSPQVEGIGRLAAGSIGGHSGYPAVY